MYGFVRYDCCRRVRKACTRFVGTKAKLERQAQWVKPQGYETNILIYNPITRCKVPLILKNRNLLTWYVCGPTVYDSAHIGHAMTYVNSDIIRRILSDHFGINIVKVMCITDIDDKIIQRSKDAERSYKDLARHYENEFIADMKRLNVRQPQLYCRVSDYIPQIIEFVRVMLEKRSAYIAKDGSVYFDTGKHATYGKLSPPLENTDHPDKKSSADFCVWKAAKEGEPFWESPWGPGRPGWHVECSAIASTVFGNSLDIHSGGIDLAFPHHENEEAQSCCYHRVEQWVNYWLHCGHLFLDDAKMSKSLKNTINVGEFLEKYTANHFRLLCLLTNYKAGLKFSDAVMVNAVEIGNKFEHFINDCENYVAGRWIAGNVDEPALLRCLEETRSSVDAALADDFNTPGATKALLNLINVANKMLHDKDTKTTRGRCVPAVAVVATYVSTIFSKFGISSSTSADDHATTDIVECFVKFRRTVRTRALQEKAKDYLVACDQARADLLACGVTVKVSQLAESLFYLPVSYAILLRDLFAGLQERDYLEYEEILSRDDARSFVHGERINFVIRKKTVARAVFGKRDWEWENGIEKREQWMIRWPNRR